MKPSTITTTMYIEREEGEILVTITGTHYPFRAGRRAHPMDRFAEPDDPETMEDITAHWPVGDIELTEKEQEQAEEALWEALSDLASNDAESRIEAKEDR